MNCVRIAWKVAAFEDAKDVDENMILVSQGLVASRSGGVLEVPKSIISNLHYDQKLEMYNLHYTVSRPAISSMSKNLAFISEVE